MADEEIHALIRVLPEPLRVALEPHPVEDLLEIVLDLGRTPEARYPDRAVRLSSSLVSREDLDHVVAQLGEFGEDNRAGIARTLHRISAIRNRRGDVVGLTLRVGRAVFGTIDAIRDLVESGGNLLLLGRPGVGKTTKLREVARVLADDLGKRVVVIDTSNEIAGDGDVPHPAIGSARRMQVPRPDRQHDLMIEAVENHMPEAIVVDEIGTGAEAAAARTIAERGVQLVGTAHGNTLENLVLNPTLSDLVGGVETVILSDEEARRRGSPKTVAERRAPPTFDVVVELIGRDDLVVHPDTARAVDRLLAGRAVGGEERRLRGGQVDVQPVLEPAPAPALPEPAPRRGPLRIHLHGVDPQLVAKVCRELDADVRIVGRVESADLVLVRRSRLGDTKVQAAMNAGVAVHDVKRGTTAELGRVLRNALNVVPGVDVAEVREAVAEAEHAIRRVVAEGVAVPLSPRPPRLRALQHRLVVRHHLEAESTGSEPTRHLVVLPDLEE